MTDVKLGKAEKEIHRLILTTDLSYFEIAKQLVKSERAVCVCANRVIKKHGARNRIGLLLNRIKLLEKEIQKHPEITIGKELTI